MITVASRLCAAQRNPGSLLCAVFAIALQVEYDIHGRRVKQESEAEAENQDEIAQAAREVEMLLQQGLPTPLDTPPRTAAVDSSEVHWTAREEKVFEEALGLELFKLQEAPAAGLVRQPRLGDSPRNNTHTDLLYKYPNIDEAWLRHTLAYQKPDGRKYRLHEKRRRPPPQPILAPSVYSQELAPAYTTAELDKLTPGEFRGFGRKHDLVSFYTTGKPLPGPSLSEIAAKGAPLQVASVPRIAVLNPNPNPSRCRCCHEMLLTLARSVACAGAAR